MGSALRDIEGAQKQLERAVALLGNTEPMRARAECLLAICPQRPHPDDDPRDLDVQFRLPVDRQSWESAGGSRLLHVEPSALRCRSEAMSMR